MTCKVFLRRFNESAIVIQSIVRGFQCRQKVTRYIESRRYGSSALLIQKAIRQFLNRKSLLQIAAAVKVQAAYRGWSYRVSARVFLLTRKLERIEYMRKQELNAIERAKHKEVRNRNHVLAEQRIAAALLERNLTDLLEQEECIITFLRRENKKLRETNEAFYSGMDLLRKENKLLETQQFSVGLQGCTLDKDLKQVHGQIQHLEHACQQCEHRKIQFKAAIALRDEYIMAENRFGRLYLTAIQHIVQELEDRCKDPALVYKIEELCLDAYDH